MNFNTNRYVVVEKRNPLNKMAGTALRGSGGVGSRSFARPVQFSVGLGAPVSRPPTRNANEKRKIIPQASRYRVSVAVILGHDFFGLAGKRMAAW